MKRHARKAFTALKRLGAPVFENKPGVDGYGEHFFISAEENYDEIWADTYEARALERFTDSGELIWQAGVNPKITRVLRANGLMFEWINAGMIGIYDA